MRTAVCLLLIALAACPAHATPKLPAATEPNAAAGPAPVVPRIVKDDVSGEHRRIVTVVIDRRVAESEIARMAAEIKGRGRATFDRTYVNFHLAGQPIEHGAWAIATFAPDIKLRVAGLRLEDERDFIADAKADKRALLGAWLTSAPAANGMLTHYRDKKRIVAEWRLREGTRSVDEVVERPSPSGRRFDTLNGSGDYYVLGRAGELELRQGQQLIALAEPIKDIGEKPETKPAPRPAPVASSRPHAATPLKGPERPRTSLSAEIAQRQFQR